MRRRSPGFHHTRRMFSTSRLAHQSQKQAVLVQSFVASVVEFCPLACVVASILVICVLLPAVIVFYLILVFVDPKPFWLLKSWPGVSELIETAQNHRELVTAGIAASWKARH